MILNATVRNPIISADMCVKWLTKLVDIIDMQILIDPVARYCDTEGNEGVTGTVVIETSHASIHVWHKEENPYIRMDVYSCKDFNPSDVLKHLDDAMFIVESDHILIDRNNTKLSIIN